MQVSCLGAFAFTRTWSAILSLSCLLKSDRCSSEALTSSLQPEGLSPPLRAGHVVFQSGRFSRTPFRCFYLIFFSPVSSSTLWDKD